MTNKKILLIFIALIFTSITITAQDSFRIMTYNILNYPSKIASTRNPHFKNVVEAINPDLLIVQEIESISGVTLFSENVLDSNYTAGAFINGYDTDNALFYKHSKFEFLDNTPVKTALRDIAQLTVRHIASDDTLIIYSVHLKASSGSTNEQKRLAEVKNLRAVTDQLPANTDYMVVGDFNFYSSNEPGFQALVNQDESGYFLDPISKFGTWHNSSGYRAIHTQSTRLTNLSDEGSSGGLDDRFDFILVSESVMDLEGISYIPESYTSFGNDENHFNKALIELPNAIVTDELARSLYYSSDHLPVFADFKVETMTSVDQYSGNSLQNYFYMAQNYPNPFNPTTTISYSIPQFKNQNNSFVKVSVYNSMGEEVTELVNRQHSAGNYEIEFNGSNLSSGTYFYTMRIGNTIVSKKMLLLK